MKRLYASRFDRLIARLRSCKKAPDARDYNFPKEMGVHERVDIQEQAIRDRTDKLYFQMGCLDFKDGFPADILGHAADLDGSLDADLTDGWLAEHLGISTPDATDLCESSWAEVKDMDFCDVQPAEAADQLERLKRKYTE